MATLKLGFALEGNSDSLVIPILARRLIGGSFPDISLATDSVRRPRNYGHGFIKVLPIFARQLRNEDSADIMVAVVDTDTTQINERRKQLVAAKERCANEKIAICIAEGLAVRNLEAWLLADARAIFKVFDGDKSAVMFSSPEDEPDPKGKLNHFVRVLTEGREISFASFAPELADAINVPTLRKQCPQFDEFAHNLVNCVKEWQRPAAAH